MPAPVCSECGKPSLARGLCRLHYDKSRVLLRFAISEEHKGAVLALAKDKGWGIPYTINQLIGFGIRWMGKKEAIEKEWGT
jgi:hypothetical protein